MLGLTFKEDVPDLRNSKIADLVESLSGLGHDVTMHDPFADEAEASHKYGINLDGKAFERSYDLVVLAVPHADYRRKGVEFFRGLLNDGGLLADLKGTLKAKNCWTL